MVNKSKIITQILFVVFFICILNTLCFARCAPPDCSINPKDLVFVGTVANYIDNKDETATVIFNISEIKNGVFSGNQVEIKGQINSESILLHSDTNATYLIYARGNANGTYTVYPCDCSKVVQ